MSKFKLLFLNKHIPHDLYIIGDSFIFVIHDKTSSCRNHETSNLVCLFISQLVFGVREDIVIYYERPGKKISVHVEKKTKKQNKFTEQFFLKIYFLFYVSIPERHEILSFSPGY